MKINATIHQRFHRLTLLSFLLLTVILLLSACTSNQERETLTGYITIDNGRVYLDEVEVITTEDTARIEELGLTYQGDLISGYYIYNENEETVAYELSDKTVYRFVDIGQRYTSEEGLNYETTSLEEFLAGSNYASNATLNESDLPTGRIPYSVEVEGELVISITEEFIYTF